MKKSEPIKAITIEQQLDRGDSKQEVLYNILSHPIMYSQEGMYEFIDTMTDEELKDFKSRDGSYLHIAAKSCDLKMVKYLLSRGLDVNCVSGIHNGGSLIKNVLRVAPSITNVKKVDEEKLRALREIIKILLESGTDLHHQVTLAIEIPEHLKSPSIIEVITKLAPINDPYIVDMVKEYYYKNDSLSK